MAGLAIPLHEKIRRREGGFSGCAGFQSARAGGPQWTIRRRPAMVHAGWKPAHPGTLLLVCVCSQQMGGTMTDTPERKARRIIDANLEAAGWLVQSHDDLDLTAGSGIAVREFPMKPGFGTADYVLYVDRLAIGTIEAKPGGTLTGVEEQSAKYAVGFPDDVPAHHLPLPFVFERHQSGRPGEGAGFPCVGRAPPERVDRAASDLRRCPPAQAVPAGSPSTTRRDRPPAARGHSGSAPACLRGGGTGSGSRGTPGRRVAENCSPIS